MPLCWPPMPTQEHGVRCRFLLAMMKAPLKPGTRPVDTAQLAVEDTSTDGPVFVRRHPGGDGPRRPAKTGAAVCV